MSSDGLESKWVILITDMFLHLINHDYFGVYSFQISTGHLESYSSLIHSHYFSASLHQSMVKHLFLLYFS